MKLKDSVALVTGANRGLGAAFVKALQEAGVRKIYAAARDPATIKIAGVQPLRLDVTNPADIAAAAKIAGDVNLLINNAGIIRDKPLLPARSVAEQREEMETNFFGALEVAQAFAPILKANGGGAIANVLSVLSWVSLPGTALYSASKAAAWSLTNALRQELKPQGTQVVALHVGYMDTDMAANAQGPKSDPLAVAKQVLDAIENGRDEVLADDISRQVKAGLSPEKAVYLGALG
jgi:NAD(P)-dependent dehydrogenase (short-subunit alcohol dehydrogenase family)